MEKINVIANTTYLDSRIKEGSKGYIAECVNVDGRIFAVVVSGKIIDSIPLDCLDVVDTSK